MATNNGQFEYALGLLPGETVEVRSAGEILATLDERGMLDAMPFMPEMLEHCGKRFTVSKRADKTCDTIHRSGGRRLYHTVHLEGLRCDGAAHGECGAGCLLFWKEAWLKRAGGQPRAPLAGRMLIASERGRTAPRPARSVCSPDTLNRQAARGNGADTVYMCQTTELYRATRPLPWWDVRQYFRDVAIGNVGPARALRVLCFAAFRNLVLHLKLGQGVLTRAYDRWQRRRGGPPWPYHAGTCTTTPAETLDLQPGELVEVKPYPEILATLDKHNKNRGLYFDVEMVPFCGKRFRVARRVQRIIGEDSGRMLKLPNDCIILEDVTCPADYSARRLFCPRAIYSYWREIWLRRA